MNSVDVSGFTTKVFHYETFRLAAKWDGILLLRDSTEPELGHCVTGNNKQKIQTTAILSKRWVMALYLRTFCGIKFNRSRTQGKHRGVVLKSHPVLAHRLGDRADRIGHRIQGLSCQELCPCCLLGRKPSSSNFCSQSKPYREPSPDFPEDNSCTQPPDGSASKGFTPKPQDLSST